MSGKRQVSTTPLFSSYQQHALSIPEILEQILSFLNRRDRRHTARLVCRQWFTVCQFVPYTWTFRIKSDGDDDDYANTKKSSRADNENEEKDILTKVSLAEHLTIRVDDLSAKNQPSQQRLNFWTKAMGLLSDLVDDSKLTGKRLRLQSLYLTVGVLEDFPSQLQQLPQLTTLTTLRIDMPSHHTLQLLFIVCRACPNLEELVFQPVPHNASPRSRNFFKDLCFPGWRDETPGDWRWPIRLPTLYRLHTCILYHPLVTMHELMVFLQDSPNLSKLVLFQSFYYSESQIIHQYPSLAACVAAHSPNLKVFHLSFNAFNINYFGIEQEMTSYFATFHDLDEYSILDDDFDRPSIVRGLRTIANRVTTLNILPESFSTCNGIQPRDILCTFVHLIHFRAPSAIYHVGDMDLNNIFYRSQESSSTGRPFHGYGRGGTAFSVDDLDGYIWACRGLKTLHMSMERHPKYRQSSPETSLIVFGFLSRMCPLLEELCLTRSTMSLSFQGGFCLLTRLKHLQRITIFSDCHHGLNSRALFWIHSTPALLVWSRYLTCMSHRFQLLQRRAKEFEAPQSQFEAVCFRVMELSQELGTDMTKIGHPDDLLEWMDDVYGQEHEKDGFLAWPNLELLLVYSLYRPFYSYFSSRYTEWVMAMFRPNVKFRMRQKGYPLNAFTHRFLSDIES